MPILMRGRATAAFVTTGLAESPERQISLELINPGMTKGPEKYRRPGERERSAPKKLKLQLT
jgi:hypothetical protein